LTAKFHDFQYNCEIVIIQYYYPSKTTNMKLLTICICSKLPTQIVTTQELKQSKPLFPGFEAKMESIFWRQVGLLGTDLDWNFCFVDRDKIELGQQMKEKKLHFEKSKPRT
jgi:hypothetical protein